MIVKNAQSQVDRIWKGYKPERIRQDNMSGFSCVSDSGGPEPGLEL